MVFNGSNLINERFQTVFKDLKLEVSIAGIKGLARDQTKLQVGPN